MLRNRPKELRMTMRCDLRRRAGLDRDPDCWCNSCTCRTYYLRKRGYSGWHGMTSQQLGGPPDQPGNYWPRLIALGEPEAGQTIANEPWSGAEFVHAQRQVRERARRKEQQQQQTEPQLFAMAA